MSKYTAKGSVVASRHSRLSEKTKQVGSRAERDIKIKIVLKMTSKILRFSEKPIVHESIQEYEYHEYEPQAKTNLNIAGEININIELQDLFTHPTESYIVFEGRLTKTNERRCRCID